MLCQKKYFPVISFQSKQVVLTTSSSYMISATGLTLLFWGLFYVKFPMDFSSVNSLLFTLHPGRYNKRMQQFSRKNVLEPTVFTRISAAFEMQGFACVQTPPPLKKSLSPILFGGKGGV